MDYQTSEMRAQNGSDTPDLRHFKERSYDSFVSKTGTALVKKYLDEKNVLDETKCFAQILYRNKAEFYHWKDQTAGIPHYHRQSEICLYLGKGVFEYLVGSQKFTMHNGDLLYIPPMSIHCALVAELVQREAYDRYVLWITDQWCESLFSPFPEFRADLPHQIATHGTKWNPILSLFEKGCAAYQEAAWFIITNLLAAQIGTCIGIAVQEKSEVQKENRQPAVLLTAIEYINQHYNRKLTLEQVAKACHTSKSTLGHTFSKSLGISFNRYITQKRLMEAEHLMLQNAPMKSICHQVGFLDYPTFYRAFRKRYGMPPSEYQKILNTPVE